MQLVPQIFLTDIIIKFLICTTKVFMSSRLLARLVILLANGHLRLYIHITTMFVTSMRLYKINVIVEIYHKNNLKFLTIFANKINTKIQSWESYFIKVICYHFCPFF